MVRNEKMVLCEFTDLKTDVQFSVFANDYEDLLKLLDKYPNRDSLDIRFIEECDGFAIE